jgi:hypothetical protein
MSSLPNPHNLTDDEFVRIGGQTLMYESLPVAWQIEALERIDLLVRTLNATADAYGFDPDARDGRE